MGKRRSGSKHQKKSSSSLNNKKFSQSIAIEEEALDDDSLFDPVDHFDRQKDMVLLSSEGEEAENANESLLNLPGSSDDDMDDNAVQNEDFEHEEQEVKEDDFNDSKWGRSKKNYYAADRQDGAAEEEAKEAARLHQRKLASLKVQDFGVSGAGSSSGSRTIVFSSDDEDDVQSEPTTSTLAIKESVEDLQQELAEKELYLQEQLANLMERIAKRQKTPFDSDAHRNSLGKAFSFMRVKERLLRAYCTHLALFITLCSKSSASKNGEKVEERKRAVVERLVEYRVLMEKIRPVEQRMLSTIDRLLQTASAKDQEDRAVASGALHVQRGSDGEEDEELEMLTARPRPEAIIGIKKSRKGKEQSSDDEVEDEGTTYKAPRSRSVPYPHESKNALLASAEKDLLVSSSDNDIFDEEGDDSTAPSAIDSRRNFSHKLDPKETARMKEREAFEEENMMRFLESGKERRRREQLSKPRNELDSLARLSDAVFKSGSSSSKRSSLLDEDSESRKKSRKDSDAEDEEELSDIEDDMPKKKRERKQRGTTTYRLTKDLPKEGAPRPINYAISKNKGLTPKRPDENRNPRVRNRMRFERANKRLGSFKKVSNGSSGKYSGEGSGIRKNLSRSVRY